MKKVLLTVALAALAGCSNMSHFASSGECTTEKAMMHGMNGKAYTGQCAGNQAAEMAWKKAYKRHEMKELAIGH